MTLSALWIEISLMRDCNSQAYLVVQIEHNKSLQFDTAYNPCARPDMAYFGFTNKLLKSKTIPISNYRNRKCDFTYIDDIMKGHPVMLYVPEKQDSKDNLSIYLMEHIISVIVALRTFWTLSTSSKKNLSVPICFLQIITSKLISNLLSCELIY